MLKPSPEICSPWREVELIFAAVKHYTQPYLEVDAYVVFTHAPSGQVLRRPAFWDGGSRWRVRFASPESEGIWSWESFAYVDDVGLVGQRGKLAAQATASNSLFEQHGFWRMSPGKRNLVHADGKPALLCGDTAWALPWRATIEQAEVYANDRQRKGYNAALLMVVQPDMNAEGPDSRMEDYGFARGFDDLCSGHLNELRPDFFQYFDRLVDVLLDHEIVPVYQPVFHGYGWKGKQVAGQVVSGEEYVRFCRYIVARYGARPAIYLVGADDYGLLDSVRAGGEMVHASDCYDQPTGVHYNPMALNRSWQACDWLDFQWCQTGHGEEHLPERVMDMWHQQPVKAVCNAEPTYERMGGYKAEGWWQGHEAWSNLCAGGTMGVVYGAASLWQWRLHKDEPGHESWCADPDAGWEKALNFEGSNYPGVVRRILEQYDFTDMHPDWRSITGKRGLAAGNRFLLVYSEHDGDIFTGSLGDAPDGYRVYCARTGEVLSAGKRTSCSSIAVEKGRPAVIVFSDELA
ncbi:DUF4038 domain-containing protein [Cerasicoccus frondis]|uniref:apiosidase-like domain-containing protein n=1 Tax=Cerasicoccus frondis TaxID=490090 RepID=UPI002852A403|nr:DUF4038 domain-containing protein [Cerasicoccus frondis]